MKTTRLVSVLAALALLLMACATDDQPTVTDTSTPEAPDTTDTPGELDGDVDEAVLERLATAAANTVDEGTARFTIEARSASATGTDTDPTDDATDDPTDDPTDDATDTGTGATEEPTDGATDTGTGATEEPTDGATDTGTSTDMETGTAGRADLVVEGEVDFDEELRELQFMGPQGQLTAIVDGDELYVQLPATEDGEFARIDLNELVEADASFGGPAGIPFQDPERTLDALRDAVVEAHVLDDDVDVMATPEVEASPTPDVGATGTETPDVGATGTETPDVGATGTETPDVGATGTETPDAGATGTETPATGGAEDARHLFVVIDLEQASDSADARHFAAMSEQYGIQTVDMEVWIDEQDRIEQIAYTLPLSQASTGGDGATGSATEATEDAAGATEEATDTGVDAQEDLVVTIAYHDFGVQVDITVPDEDQVVDLDEQELRQSLPSDGAAGTGTGRSPAPDVDETPGVEDTPTSTETPTSTDTPTPTDTPTSTEGGS